MIKVQTFKGFRDFLPYETRKQKYVVSILKSVFESSTVFLRTDY